MDFEAAKIALTGDNPAGANEEYNPLYAQLDELAHGTAGSVMGDSVIDGKSADFRALGRACETLWATTRDWRVAAYAAYAATQTDGLAGLAGGISLLRWLADELWDEAYPQLDPDDDNDPTERLNILQILSPNPAQSMGGTAFLRDLRRVKLFSNLPYILRDLLIANGELETQSELNTSVFFAETAAAGASQAGALVGTIDGILADLAAIEELIFEKTAQKYSFSFDILANELKGLRRFYAGISGGASEGGAADDGEVASENSGETEKNVVLNSKNIVAFDLSSFCPKTRGEAILAAQKAMEYFRANEPSSPAPYFFERGIRSAQMDFVELLGDIEPNALGKVREILGIKS